MQDALAAHKAGGVTLPEGSVRMAVSLDGTESEEEIKALKDLKPVMALLNTASVSRTHASRRVFQVGAEHEDTYGLGAGTAYTCGYQNRPSLAACVRFVCRFGPHTLFTYRQTALYFCLTFSPHVSCRSWSPTNGITTPSHLHTSHRSSSPTASRRP